MNIPSYSKYKNTKVLYDGHKFDSIRERQRYQELRLLERAGKIKELFLQPEFILQPAFKDQAGKHQIAIKYRADFSYVDMDLGEVIIEDVKPSLTFKTEVYRIKKKLFLYKYNDLIFKETY